MPVINQDTFISRLKSLYSMKYETVNNCFSQVDYLICINEDTEEVEVKKPTELLLWLLEWDLPDTITVFGKKTIIFLSSKHLTFLKSSLDDKTLQQIKIAVGVDILYLETHDNKDNEKVFEEAIDLMRVQTEYGKVGVFRYEKDSTSQLEKVWYKCLNKYNWFEMEMSEYVANLISVKDDKDIQSIKKACHLSIVTYVESIKLICESLSSEKCQDKPVKNIDIAMNIGNGVMNGTYFPKEHFKAIDFSYFPIIKSGNLDNLTIHSGSDDEELKAGIIIVSLGIRYYQFCSSITRTFIMFPTYNTMVAKNYVFLLKVQEVIINLLQDGMELAKIYKDTISFVKNERPELVNNLADTFGSVIGMKPEENFLQIKADIKAIARENMTFNVMCGFRNILYQPGSIKVPLESYSLWVGDIVQVQKGKPALILAPLCKEKCGIMWDHSSNSNNHT